MADANDDICSTQVTQCSSQNDKPWPGTQTQLQERGRHSGYSGCKGQGGGSGQNPRRSFESPVQIPKITKIKSWHSQVSEWKSTSSKSMSMMVLIPKIDVGEGLDAQNRCRWGFGCQKPMSVRVWVPKIDVGDGLNSQNRWRRGLIIFQRPKVNVPDDIWYIDFGYTLSIEYWLQSIFSNAVWLGLEINILYW